MGKDKTHKQLGTQFCRYINVVWVNSLPISLSLHYIIRMLEGGKQATKQCFSSSIFLSIYINLERQLPQISTLKSYWAIMPITNQLLFSYDETRKQLLLAALQNPRQRWRREICLCCSSISFNRKGHLRLPSVDNPFAVLNCMDEFS